MSRINAELATDLLHSALHALSENGEYMKLLIQSFQLFLDADLDDFNGFVLLGVGASVRLFGTL